MEDLDFIQKKEAKEFFLKLVKRTKLTWSSLFPNANPIALDLLEKMLTFNPKKDILLINVYRILILKDYMTQSKNQLLHLLLIGLLML
jgi:mitogen-activated protein kinase 1/3